LMSKGTLQNSLSLCPCLYLTMQSPNHLTEPLPLCFFLSGFLPVCLLLGLSISPFPSGPTLLLVSVSLPSLFFQHTALKVIFFKTKTLWLTRSPSLPNIPSHHELYSSSLLPTKQLNLT
jgi:hypothetical protein